MDVAFLAASFSGSEVSSFVQKAKSLKAGQDCAFVLLVRGENQDKSSIAQAVLDGVDGFLFEPYSVDALDEIAKLATRVRRERSVEREKLAMTLLISDIIRQIDLVAYLKSCELEPERTWKRLVEACAPMRSYSAENQAVFFETLIEEFIKAPLPARSFQASQYKGASQRVKRKMAEKVVAEVEAQLSTPEKQ